MDVEETEEEVETEDEVETEEEEEEVETEEEAVEVVEVHPKYTNIIE
jgi:hypothetical protein